MTVQEIFAQRLKARREELGLTQKDLAERLSFVSTTVCSYERLRQEPSLQTLSALADELEVSVDWLLGRANQRH